MIAKLSKKEKNRSVKNADFLQHRNSAFYVLQQEIDTNSMKYYNQ